MGRSALPMENRSAALIPGARNIHEWRENGVMVMAVPWFTLIFIPLNNMIVGLYNNWPSTAVLAGERLRFICITECWRRIQPETRAASYCSFEMRWRQSMIVWPIWTVRVRRSTPLCTAILPWRIQLADDFVELTTRWRSSPRRGA